MPELLRFVPLYQTRVWGGRRLESLLHRQLPDAQPYGESWELCDREEAQSVVAAGSLAGQSLHELWTYRRAEIFGARFSGHSAKRFPILLKILDCSDTLSVQVHPPAHVAPILNGEPKTEMWFVAHAEPGAQIYAGLKHGVDRARFELALDAGEVEQVVHAVTPQRGEFMFVESGRLHALGAGLLVYEIQQNSDTTYRVFDWNRVGLDGKPRALHVEQSLRCINFDDFEPQLKTPAVDGAMVRCDHFDTRRTKLTAGQAMDLSHPGEFVCLAVTQGAARLGDEKIGVGEFVLVPASLPQEQRRIVAEQDTEFLEIRLP